MRMRAAGGGGGLLCVSLSRTLSLSLVCSLRSRRPPLSPRAPPSNRARLTQFKTVKPSGDRVLVKVDKEEGRTQGGVLLPTVAQNKPTAGAIVALGDVELVKVRYVCALVCRVRRCVCAARPLLVNSLPLRREA